MRCKTCKGAVRKIVEREYNSEEEIRYRCNNCGVDYLDTRNLEEEPCVMTEDERANRMVGLANKFNDAVKFQMNVCEVWLKKCKERE